MLGGRSVPMPHAGKTAPLRVFARKWLVWCMHLVNSVEEMTTCALEEKMGDCQAPESPGVVQFGQ